ncbi:hypothetical protein NHP21005_20200 (plasmid) [Helicobacter sp. NHP21005]|nr:hypothetical protein NHP21005_20200 [Helicobacter sp. NHP21005]
MAKKLASVMNRREILARVGHLDKAIVKNENEQKALKGKLRKLVESHDDLIKELEYTIGFLKSPQDKLAPQQKSTQQANPTQGK